jgi:hypothetical protein
VTVGALAGNVRNVPTTRRRCAYCDTPLSGELGAAARYCSRAHRQRAYEARQADQTEQLRRRIRALERQLASFERVIETVAERGPDCAAAVTDALRQETEVAFARLKARRGGANPAG